jgi:hypothetical protein
VKDRIFNLGQISNGDEERNGRRMSGFGEEEDSES